MKLRNKVVVVTGAGGGIGRQLVLQLIEKGAYVAAVDMNLETLNQTKDMAQKNGGKVTIHPADITQHQRVFDLPDEIRAEHGKIDVLINNAGIIQPFMTTAELSDDIIRRMMEINFFGMLNMVKAFLPCLAESPEAYIANVSSMGGFLPVPGQSIYGASKAAVKLVTEGLRLELSRTQIGVSVVIPGGIETDIKKNSGLKENSALETQKRSAGLKLTSSENAAKVILRGIEKNKAKIFIGRDAFLMDIFYKLIPERTGRMISRMMAKNHGGIFNTAEDLKLHTSHLNI